MDEQTTDAWLFPDPTHQGGESGWAENANAHAMTVLSWGMCTNANASQAPLTLTPASLYANVRRILA